MLDVIKVEESPLKEAKRRPRRTKEELKEQLREQKVIEKRMALRRQRTRNRRYTSAEFTSIFTEKKNLLSNEGYVEVVEEQIVEESVEVDTSVMSLEKAVDYTQGVPSYDESPPTPTQDEAYICSVPDNEVILTTEQSSIPIVEVASATPTSIGISQLSHMTRSRAKRLSEDKNPGEPLSSRPSTPYSDISDASKSDSFGEIKRGRGRPKKTDDKDSTGRQTPELSGRRSARSTSPESR